MEQKIRVAYVGRSRFGESTVLVSDEYSNPARPGWSRSITQSFKYARDDQEAQAIAARMKATGKVDIIQTLL